MQIMKSKKSTTPSEFEFCHQVAQFYAENNSSADIPAAWYGPLFNLDFQKIAKNIMLLALGACNHFWEQRYRNQEDLISFLKTEDDGTEIRVYKCVVASFLVTYFDERRIGNHVDTLTMDLGLTFQELVKDCAVMQSVIEPSCKRILAKYSNLKDEMFKALDELNLNPAMKPDGSAIFFRYHDETVTFSLLSQNKFSLSVDRGEGEEQRIQSVNKQLVDDGIFDRSLSLANDKKLRAEVFFYRAHVEVSNGTEILEYFASICETLFAEYELFTGC